MGKAPPAYPYGNMIRIENPKDSRVSPFCLIKHKEDVSQYFLCDHEKTVVRLLESSWVVKSIFGTEHYLQKHSDKIKNKGVSEDQIFFAEESVFLETIGFSMHRGFIALGVIPENKSLDDLKSPIVICSELADAENLGSILRTASAFGIKDILVDEKTTSPYLRRSVRVSMGNLFYQRIRRSESLLSDLKDLKQKGICLVGLSLPDPRFTAKQKTLPDFQFPEKFALLLGNEANGLADTIKSECDILVSIPMALEVDSLNVSHSLASLLGFRLSGTPKKMD